MQTKFRTQRRVEFSDTDMVGIAHFTSFFRFMEEAEHALLRARGLSVVLTDAKGTLGFPKLSCKCDYRRPLRYEELVDIDVTATCDRRKTITYEFEFQLDDASVASGQLTVAYCRFPTDKPPYAIPIHDWVLRKLFELSDETTN